MINITVSEIKEQFKNGVTRTKDDKHYNQRIGSLEEMYNVPAQDIKDLFKYNPVLRGLRVTPYKEPVFNLIDDTLEESADTSVDTPSVLEINLDRPFEPIQVAPIVEPIVEVDNQVLPMDTPQIN